MFISFFQVRQSRKLKSAQPTLTIHRKKNIVGYLQLCIFICIWFNYILEEGCKMFAEKIEIFSQNLMVNLLESLGITCNSTYILCNMYVFGLALHSITLVWWWYGGGGLDGRRRAQEYSKATCRETLCPTCPTFVQKLWGMFFSVRNR